MTENAQSTPVRIVVTGPDVITCAPSRRYPLRIDLGLRTAGGS